MKVLSILAILGLGFSANAATSGVGLLVEHIELETRTATILLAGDDLSNLRETVDELLRSGDAEVREIGYLVTNFGQRCQLRGVQELIYPLEWDPPELKVKQPLGPGGTQVEILPRTPTAFEMRWVGHILELDVEASAGGAAVAVSSELVGVAGKLQWGAGQLPAKFPLFDTRKVQGRAQMAFGESALIGAYCPLAGAGGRTVLVFVKVAAAGVPTAESDAEIDDPFMHPLKGADHPGAAVAVTLEMVEVAAPLGRKVLDAKAGVGIWPLLDPAIESGDAELVSSSRLRTRDGQRAKIEDTHEFIYPNTFDQPGQGFGSITLDANGLPLPQPQPLAFEMRNVGMTMEIEPVIVGTTEGDAIALNIAPELVRYLRMIDYGSGEAGAIQPLFDTAVMSAAMTIADGRDTLLAAFTPRHRDTGDPRSERVLLVIARAEIEK